MFSVIVSDRKSDMENRQAIRPEQRKLFPSDYFSRNFSLMIISLNCRIFAPDTVNIGFRNHPPSEGSRFLNPARPLNQGSGYSNQVVAKARV